MIRLVLGVVAVILVFKGACTQESDTEFDERLDKITERLVSYNRCRIDNDCNDNSFCYGNDNDRVGRCKCQAGFELLLRNRTYYACLKLAVWGDECQINEQCVDNLGSLARCNGVCGCTDGTFRYPWDGRCHESVLLQDFCRTDANCILEDGSYAFCADGQCECNLGLSPSFDKKRCVQVKNLGQNCTDEYQCSFIGNSVCREVCRCSVGHVVSRNGSTCLKAATYFFDSCDENAQCSEFLRDSVCISNNCTCQYGFHNYETRCVRSAAIGQICAAADQCILDSQYQTIVDCIDGVCQCLPGVTDPNGQIGCSNNGFKLNVNILLAGFLIVVYNLLFLYV